MAHGLRVNYIGIDALALAYELEGKKLGGQFPDDTFFLRYVEGYDVVILDDINSKYGIAQNIIRAALEYATTHNTAVVITCNEEVGQVLNDRLCTSINPLRNPYAFLGFTQHLDGESQRRPWRHEVEPPGENTKPPNLGALQSILPSNEITQIASVLSYAGSQGAGTVVSGDRQAAAAIAGALMTLGVEGVRLIPEPFDEHGKCRHLDDLDTAHVLVMTVDSNDSYDQLTKVAMSAYHTAAKLVVVANAAPSDVFTGHRRHTTSPTQVGGHSPRILARMEQLFAGYDSTLAN